MSAEEKLKIISEFGRLIYGKKNLRDIFDIITTFIERVVNSDRCSLYLVDEKSNELRAIIAHGLDYELRIPLSNGIAGYVAVSKEVLITDDAYSDRRFDRSFDKKNHYRTKTLLTMPVINKYGEAIAVIQAINKLDGLFTQEDSNIVLFIAEFMSVAIENSIAYEIADKMLKERTQELRELNNTLEQKIKGALSEIKEKDEMLVLHTRRSAMGEMIGVIAHQLKQPLTSMQMISGMLASDIELNKFTKAGALKDLKTIKEVVGSMNRTIDDFRHFFNPNKKKDRESIETIIKRAYKLIERQYIIAEVDISISCESRTKIDLLSTELVQVVLNILKNALDALLERDIKEKKVSISAYEDKKDIYIEIEDNAGGIEQKTIDRLFERYFSTKDEKHGTGVGLYISKIIVEEHSKGELSVCNTDRGAKFTIKLPKE